MSPADDHSRWEELAVGHALSALEPADEEAFVRHVRSCPECAVTVAETRDVMAALAEAAEPTEPPASLRAAVLGGVTAERPAAEDSTLPEGTGSEDRVDELEQHRRRLDGTTGKHERRRGVRLPWYAAAAVVLLMLVLAAGNIYQLAQDGTEQTRLAQASQVVRCVESKSCDTVPIRATGGSSVPAMALVQDGHVRLMIDGLDTNDAASTMYVLWQKGGGQLRALRGFDVTESGVVWVDGGRLGASLESTKFLAVSHEQGNKLPSKPAKVVAVGNVSS